MAIQSFSVQKKDAGFYQSSATRVDDFARVEYTFAASVLLFAGCAGGSNRARQRQEKNF